MSVTANGYDACADALRSILNNYPGQSGIIYCPTKVSAVTVSGDLAMYSDGRIKASFFHSEVKAGDKARRYGQWMRGEIHVMCATAGSS